jgi:hypothetical protein
LHGQRLEQTRSVQIATKKLTSLDEKVEGGAERGRSALICLHRLTVNAQQQGKQWGVISDLVLMNCKRYVRAP